MVASLQFLITKIDGTQVVQGITCPSDAVEAAVQKMFAQYSQVGVLKKDTTTNKYTLIPSSQLALVEIVVPTLVGATEYDVNKVAVATEGLRKIKI